MKKYFMPSLAVLLAIGFSAFTAPTPVETKRADTTLFWYFYDYNNNKLDGQIGDVEKTHEQAQEVTGCLDPQFAVIECARGYEEEQDPNQEAPGIGADRVKRLPE